MKIANDRNKPDLAFLDIFLWKKMKQGIDGYPIYLNCDNCIAGGKDKDFKAKKIEIFGV